MVVVCILLDFQKNVKQVRFFILVVTFVVSSWPNLAGTVSSGLINHKGIKYIYHKIQNKM